MNCQLFFSFALSLSLCCSTLLSHWSQWPALEMDACRMLVPTSPDIKISIYFRINIEYYSSTTPAALTILLFLFVGLLFVLSFLISWATRDVEKKNKHTQMTLRCLNVFSRSRSRSGKQAATAAAQTQTVSNRFNASLLASQFSASVCVCVCICEAYLMRLCFTCMCVCSSPNRRLAPWTALTLFNWLCSLQNCHSHGKCEREADSLALRLTVIASAWHRFINWFLLWFSQLVRCGAVCVRSVNERYSQTTHAFLFRLSLSSPSSSCSPVLLAIVDIGFGSSVNRGKQRGRKRERI